MASTALDTLLAAWEVTPRPVENFLAERVAALTYGIELDIEHQAAYIRTMLEALRSGNRLWNYVLRVGNELRDLAEFRHRLEALELPEEGSQRFYRYMDATDALLKEILREASRSVLGMDR